MSLKELKVKYMPLYEKYKDMIPYLIFGVLSTAVNIVAYWVAAHPFALSTTLSTCIAWLAAVIFAYVTNRIFVFHSTVRDFRGVVKEIAAFFGCRLATGVLDLGIMWLFVDVLLLNDMIIKIISNVIVVVLNYVASKLMIFKSEK